MRIIINYSDENYLDRQSICIPYYVLKELTRVFTLAEEQFNIQKELGIQLTTINLS